VNWSRDWNSGNQRSWSNSIGSDRSRSVSRDWRRGVGNGFSDVFDIGNVTGVSVSNAVGDNLGATVGEVDAVLTVGGVTVASLVVAEVCTAMVSITLDSVAEFVDWRGVWVDRSCAVGRSRGVERSRCIRSRGWPVRCGSGSVWSSSEWDRMDWCNTGCSNNGTGRDWAYNGNRADKGCVGVSVSMGMSTGSIGRNNSHEAEKCHKCLKYILFDKHFYL
jgi:hypothetical protein